MKKLMMTVMVAFSAAVCVAADAAKDAKPAEKATDAEAKEMARHADISTTMIYSHHIQRLEQAAEDKVAALLDD